MVLFMQLLDHMRGPHGKFCVNDAHGVVNAAVAFAVWAVLHLNEASKVLCGVSMAFKCCFYVLRSDTKMESPRCSVVVFKSAGVNVHEDIVKFIQWLKGVLKALV